MASLNFYNVTAGLIALFFISLSGCMNSHEFRSDKNRWPVEFEIFRSEDDKLRVRLTNSTYSPITTRVTYDDELTYGGVFAYDSLFCAEKKIRLSMIVDFFNYKLDTIQPTETKEFFTSIYDPFVAEVLDSTSIYSFNFDLHGLGKGHYRQYIICARGADGTHRMANAANELLDSNRTTTRFELNDVLCQSELLTVENPSFK